MKESHANPSPRWPAWLTILFLILFAIFWSLGSFFFWGLFGLTLCFGFLWIYTSASFRAKMDAIRSAFSRQSRPPKNPYQAFRPRSEAQSSPVQPLNIPRVIRLLTIGFFALFFFFFIVGLFFGDDEGAGEEVTLQNYEEAPLEDSTTVWNDRGNAALENNKFDSAFYYYDQALAIDPQSVYALYNKGLAYSLKQDYRRSNGLARQCVLYHPDYDPAWWLLGYNYDLTSNVDSAMYCLEKAYANGYNQPDFLQLVAEVYVKRDRRKEALEVYKRIVDMDTTRAEIFRKMAELDPVNADTYRNKARALDGN
jgi:tetratricopeptide (TPR) repeat protein